MSETLYARTSLHCFRTDPAILYGSARNLGNQLRRKSIPQLVIVLGVFIYAASNAFLTGGLGVAARDIGMSEFQVGIILGLGALLVIPTAPVWGTIAEEVNRRTLILISLPMVAVGPLAMALVFSNMMTLTVTSAFWMLVVARSIKGIFGGALLTTTQALIADTTATDWRVSGMGAMGASVTAGALFGSILLWSAAGCGIAFGFFLLVLGVIIAFAISYVCLPNVHAAAGRKSTEPVPVRNVWHFFLMTFLGFTSYAMIVPTIGLRLVDGLNLSSTDAIATAGLILALTTFALTISQLIISACRTSVSVSLFWGSGLGVLIGLIALFAAERVLSTAIAMLIIGGSLGCLVPCLMGGLSLSVGPGVQGKVAGLNIAFRGLGLAVGPIIGTWLYRIDMNAPLIAAAIAMLLLLPTSLRKFQPALS
ncbi:MFS transporter [Ruegeria arenilitoris]|uniref:MFS transporter n=1 Tax=Ruegeria arenilitoris TaxID=1173585 RepID=UPI00148067ED|nr:MFS transporter [Ruegeria arenilitoris]